MIELNVLFFFMSFYLRKLGYNVSKRKYIMISNLFTGFEYNGVVYNGSRKFYGQII